MKGYKGSKIKHSGMGFLEPQVTQGTQYALAHENMHSDMNKHHSINTSQLNDIGLASQSCLCTLCIKCEGSKVLMPIDFWSSLRAYIRGMSNSYNMSDTREKMESILY